MTEQNLNHTYSFASQIDGNIQSNICLWNYDEDIFIKRSLNFNKKTLLHHYIETTLWNDYNRDIRKHGGDYTHHIEDFYELFLAFVPSKNPFKNLEKLNDDELDSYNDKFTEIWKNKEMEFRILFNLIADNVFYLLFNNRSLLLKFNEKISETVADTLYDENVLTKKGKIPRKNIPQWVKKAVYSRDKGRCIKCSIDLSGILSTDRRQNYDHIVPLNLFGVNDPTNIQLLCQSCNLTKSGNIIETTDLYAEWW
ncbi:HNH endonuclease [Nonlabens mediterrranea]|uniref:HNH endonuclease n=1 Tax=Nonlabens mediterrranea TaxID=1419947 RepID=A0ABS0A5W5_9FLAO|nr:HNH endonuclease [Nonlabens mediterrranea]